MSLIDLVGIRFLNVDQKAWVGLEETAASSEAKFHVGAVSSLFLLKSVHLISFFTIFLLHVFSIEVCSNSFVRSLRPMCSNNMSADEN